jgi:hypothetical protein
MACLPCLMALLGYEENLPHLLRHRKMAAEIPGLGLGAVSLSVAAAESMPGGKQWHELYDHATRLRKITDGMPSGTVAESYYKALNAIDASLKQAKGTYGWLDWTRKPDWVGSPALWESEYKQWTSQLQQMEYSMAQRTGVMTTIQTPPKQPAVTEAMQPTGEGTSYVPRPVPVDIIGPTGGGEAAYIAPKTTNWIAIAAAVAIFGTAIYLLWPKKGK